jgi:hypothetical protein
MNSTSKILNPNFINYKKFFFNLVSFSHIPKFKILGCDNGDTETSVHDVEEDDDGVGVFKEEEVGAILLLNGHTLDGKT